MFWILGLPAPILFGAAMALFAVLPVMGTALIWLPAALFLLVSGSWIKALILVIWGGLVVGLIDNFLYPILVADELRFHHLAVFFAVFGGLLAFGIAGVVLGPVTCHHCCLARNLASEKVSVMTTIAKILIPTALSPSCAWAARYGAQLAQRFDCVRMPTALFETHGVRFSAFSDKHG